MSRLILLLLATIVVVECDHRFSGQNFLRPLVFHNKIRYSSTPFQKRIENFTYQLPSAPAGRTIQGIMAYDLTNTDASANVTQGGVGSNFVNLRLKSARGTQIHFDVYIYA